jgi:hypothetical protein
MSSLRKEEDYEAAKKGDGRCTSLQSMLERPLVIAKLSLIEALGVNSLLAVREDAFIEGKHDKAVSWLNTTLISTQIHVTTCTISAIILKKMSIMTNNCIHMLWP